MKKINKKTYIIVFNEIIKDCKKDLLILNNLEYIVLLGSVQQNEHIPKYSDLDILFILKSDKNGCIQNDVLFNLKKISELFSKKYQIKISFLTHTIYELYAYVDYEYLSHYSWGKVVFGKKILFNQLFIRLLSQKKLKSNELKQQMLINIIHARFNLIRRYVSFNQYNISNYSKEILKLFIDNVFEITDWRLIGNNIWSKTKKDIVKNSLKYIKSRFNNVPDFAYKYRNNWNKLKINQININIFFEKSLRFINDCIKELD